MSREYESWYSGASLLARSVWKSVSSHAEVYPPPSEVWELRLPPGHQRTVNILASLNPESPRERSNWL